MVAPTLRSLIIQIDGFARSSRTTSEGTSCFFSLNQVSFFSGRQDDFTGILALFNIGLRPTDFR